MKRITFTLLAVIVAALMMPGAWGGKPFPVEFEGLVSKFNGAVVFAVKRTREITWATFRTDAQPETVFNFYEEALKKDGWRIESSNWDDQTGSGTIMAGFEGRDASTAERILNLSVSQPEKLKETEFVIKVEFVGGRE